jgi:hypothetical protein
MSKGAPDSLVCQPRHPTVRVRALELWQVGPLDSQVVHQTVTVHCTVRLLAPTLTLRALSAHCSHTVHFCRRPLALLAVTPLAHRTVRWIIAEWLPKFSKLRSSEWISLVHRTIRCVLDQGSLRLVLLLSIWTLSWTFYWFVLNLWHL